MYGVGAPRKRLLQIFYISKSATFGKWINKPISHLNIQKMKGKPTTAPTPTAPRPSTTNPSPAPSTTSKR